jgi:hypothetical protein
MTASDALRAFITPLLPGWRIQFGRWTDGNTANRYAVIKPMGGLPIALVRRPQFSLMLIGALGESAQVTEDAAQTVIAAMQADNTLETFMQPGEPVYWNTNDGRHVEELAISTITD